MRWLLFAAALLAVVPAAPAAVGDLTFKAGDLSAGALPRPLQALSADFKPATEASGTVSPMARIATMRAVVAPVGPPTTTPPVLEETPIRVAVDAASPEDLQLSVIRIDVGGKGDFKGAKAVDLRLPPAGKSGAAPFGPVEVKLTLGDKTVPVTVAGSCYMSRTGPLTLQLYLATGLEGQCQFGDKALTVRILDANGDLKFGQAVKPAVKDGAVRGLMPGDEVQVDDGGDRPSCGFYGQPIRVGGKWYTVELAADGLKVTAVPLKAATGKLKMDAEKWSMTLTSPDCVLVLSGGAEPVDVPVGKYISTNITMEKAGTIVLVPALESFVVKTPPAEIVEGKTAAAAAGAPLEAKAQVEQSGRQVALSLSLVDAGGRPVSAIMTKAGRDPGAFEIVDAAGKRVDYAIVEYT
jgi:hypothetical protein